MVNVLGGHYDEVVGQSGKRHVKNTLSWVGDPYTLQFIALHWAALAIVDVASRCHIKSPIGAMTSS